LTDRTLRVLVTGGAGFIGSHLCQRLIEAGHSVVCLDNFHTASEGNLAGLCDDPRFTLVRHDVEQAMSAEVDAIFNLACPASPVHYQFDPVRTIRTCVLGAINVLDLARRLGAPVLQASTSEVYGDPNLHPQPESYWGHVNPVGIRSCYDEGKRAAETLFTDYRRQYGVDTKLARIFNTYGPNMHPDDGRVVSNFIVQALRGDDLTLFGEGQQTRSFCYVDDLVEGLIRLMATPSDFGGPVNLGNPVEFSIAELAQLVLEITGSRSQIVKRPLPQDDPRQRCPDISLARDKLDWEPRVQLRQGLERTVAYFDALLSAG
jgi:UDP-glucuronate decarboxylase